MITIQEIKTFCVNNDYDVRKSHNGRWFDQKCTPDVVCIIADCVYQYAINNGAKTEFMSVDIWRSEYAADNVEAIFNKPGVGHKMAQNEYDKFFAQPLELLANAKILYKKKKGNRNHYSVNKLNILEYIALRERNALTFLNIYIEAVLTDSGIMYIFDDFFDKQSDDLFQILKERYEDFTISNTPINGLTEVRRIFTKVLNPLAFTRKKRGTAKGRMSKDIISFDSLMYNQANFRDIYVEKPKGITRKEYAATHPVEVNDAYFKYQSTKAKKFLKQWNDDYRNGESEYSVGVLPGDKATNIHHIFSESQFPEISYYLENLIALTPTQHYNHAHNDFNTQEINSQYQHMLLLAKSEIIESDISNDTTETIYEFDKFVYVLKAGFDEDIEIETMDFPTIVREINLHYT